MTQHDNILIVPVPEDAHSFEIIENNVIGGHCISMLRGNPDYACNHFNLPPGDWRIVGRAKELTDEQWRGVVKSFGKWGYYNYEASSQYEECLKKTATESGMSLLRSHGIDPETNPLILKREGV